MFDAHSFDGKRILVTGASSGIGRQTAIMLDALGANVVLVGRSQEKLEETMSHMPRGQHVCVAFDLCSFDEYDTLWNQCVADGKLDGMLHCAGVAKAVPVKVFSPNSIHELMDIHLVSFLMLVKYMSKKKYSNDGASIVGVSAVNVHYPQKCMSIYEAAKAGVEAAVRGLAQELYEGRKIRINALVVGPVATPMSGFAEDDISAVGTFSEVTPNLMGMAGPADIAKEAIFLLGSASSYSTGRSFFVDGGRL